MAATPVNGSAAQSVAPTAHTGPGTRRPVVVASPSCPLPLNPQDDTDPSVRSARLKDPPAFTVATSVNATGTGVRRVHAELPSPSWPPELSPQLTTEPSDSAARLW